jgi:signal transduction histidine kinase
VFRAFLTTQATGFGTGQGLTLVRPIVVDQHGGTIDLRPVPGKVTTFDVRLPMDGPPAAAPRPVAAPLGTGSELPEVTRS